MSQAVAIAIRRDRIFLVIGIALITLLGWLYLLGHAAQMPMDAVETMAMPTMALWDKGTLVLAIAMWSVMMIAMMLPTATPMILMFARVHRQRKAIVGATVPTWVFVAGYLLVWTGFAVFAASAQWALHGAGLLSSAMGSATPLLAGVLLLMTGLFQWSGLKKTCLSKCRSPLGFLLSEWREHRIGAFVMGLRHGAFCAGCCWALMLLMFVGGVMNLAWMGALAAYMLAEKVLPQARALSHLIGALLVVAGASVLSLAMTGVGMS